MNRSISVVNKSKTKEPDSPPKRVKIFQQASPTKEISKLSFEVHCFCRWSHYIKFQCQEA